jgi:hypothetical protein
MLQPTPAATPFGNPQYDVGGWFVGVDLLYLDKLFGKYNGLAPDSILSVGYKTEDNIVWQITWWDQWFSDVALPSEKLQIIDLSARFETYKTDCFRQWCIIGPRAILTDQHFDLSGGRAYDVTNVMVGGFIGAMNEWYLGTNPLGAFSFILDGDVGAYGNFLKQTASSLGGSNSTTSPFTLSGSLQGKAGFIWYVAEGVTIHFGLEALTIINMQQNLNPNFTANSVSTTLSPTMPVWLGAYLSFGFVF